MSKIIKRVLTATGALLVAAVFYVCWRSFPIATGYAAKVMCSAVFVSGRNPNDVVKSDLDFFPVNLTNIHVDPKDSSVTCSMIGTATRRAIFRKGSGATLVNDLSEQTLRAQRFRFPSLPPSISDSLPWPAGDKMVDPFPANIDTVKLADAIRIAFPQSDSPFVNVTRALIILYDGKIIAERYAPGFTAQTRLAGWSMTKSITGALAGILVKQGKLRLDAPAAVPEWQKKDDPRKTITVRHLLQQTSGLDFDEVYDKRSHANTMLFMRGDAGKYAASQKLLHQPGTQFSYSSGNTNILSRLIRYTIGDNAYHKFPYEELFYRTGMNSSLLEPDASGTFVGSSFCYATARDWARFGLLYLNNGKANGVQLLPEDWVKQSTVPATAALQGEYGFQWWLNAGAANTPHDRLFPELPADMFFADGYEGQSIFVIPSKKIVLVRLGLTKGKQWGENEVLKEVIESVR